MQVRRKAGILLVLPLIALCTGGCGGLAAAPTWSPMSLFLPGLMRNDQPKKDVPDGTPVQTPEDPAKEPILVVQAR